VLILSVLEELLLVQCQISLTRSRSTNCPRNYWGYLLPEVGLIGTSDVEATARCGWQVSIEDVPNDSSTVVRNWIVLVEPCAIRSWRRADPKVPVRSVVDRNRVDDNVISLS